MKTTMKYIFIMVLIVGASGLGFIVGKEIQRQNFVDIVYDCVVQYETNLDSLDCIIRGVE